MQIIVADNSTLSNFARLNLLNPLLATFHSVLICSGVDAEIKNAAEKYVFLKSILSGIEQGKIRVERTDSIEILIMTAKLQKEYRKLSPADATSIALAHNKRLPIAIDEKEGRKVAQVYSIPVLTTLDIFKGWKEKNIFDKKELNNFLDRLESDCCFTIKPKFRF